MSENVVPLRTNLRTPPHSTDAERGLLGSLLLNNRSYEKVGDFLLAEHFADAANARIFKVIGDMVDGGRQANAVTIKPFLENDDALISVGGWPYIAGLSKSVVTTINVADYGRMIHDMYLRREMIALGEDMVNDAFDQQVDERAVSLIENISVRLAELLSGSTKGEGLVLLSDFIQRALDRHERIDKGEITGVSTGLAPLDAALGLLEPGDLVVIAGRPGMGKTALAQTIMYHVGRHFERTAPQGGRHKTVAFFSAEMTGDESADRAIAAQTGIVAPRRRREALGESDWSRLTDFVAATMNLPVRVDERPYPTLSRIRSECRKLVRAGGVGLIVVDYIQIMGVERGKRFDNRSAEVGYFANGLKALGKELNCPVIALSQLSRRVEEREDKRPTLSDLRESGDIEQAADVVGFVYRDEYYAAREEPKQKAAETGEKFQARLNQWRERLRRAHGAADVIVAKARSGGTGIAELKFSATGTWFSDPGKGDAATSAQGSIWEFE